jgi:ADP-sugar diphosphatase
MSWFTLDDFDPPVHVELTSNITQKQLLDFRAFKDWKETLRTNLELQRTDPDHAFHSDPFVLRKIEIQSVDWFGSSRVGFVKLRASMRNSSNRELPGIAFLRGGYVAVLMILRPQDSRDERWVLMVKQPRVPAGSLSFVEIPTGMLTSVEEFDGASAREILEETGFKLRTSDLINLTELALRQSTSEGETL